MKQTDCIRRILLNGLRVHRQTCISTIQRAHLHCSTSAVLSSSTTQMKPFITSYRCYCGGKSSIKSQSIDNNSPLQLNEILDMLKEITRRHKANDKTFILPWGDTEAMELIAVPFQELIKHGVYAEFLIDACVKSDNLFRGFTRHGNQLLKVIDIIMGCTGLTYENTLRFIAYWTEELMNVTPERIENCFAVFLSRGVLAGPQMASIIYKCPELLFAVEPQQMDNSIESISAFFPSEEILSILISTPQLALKSAESLELRYEYIYYHMGIEPEEFYESIKWHELELDEIMMRHELLRRTGKYFLPDPKRPQLKMENPKIFKIFDTDDHEFATQVAGVRKEEWVLFREVFAKEKAQEDQERPYAIIKPSQRKAYERKRLAEKAHQATLDAAQDEIF